MGRFTSVDPLKGVPTDPQQRNRYMYTANNPLTRYDLDGRDIKDWFKEKASDFGKGAKNYAKNLINDYGFSMATGVPVNPMDAPGMISDWWQGVGIAKNDISAVPGAGLELYVTYPAKQLFSSDSSFYERVEAGSYFGTLLAGSRFGGEMIGTRGPSCSAKWPATAKEMDTFLNMKGMRIPDSLETLSRNKIIWQPSDRIKITFEQHPYDIGAPSFHTDPHWYLDTPWNRHQLYLPGQFVPGF